MDDSQITGTASSYARKYALNGLYLIDDTKDADTDEYKKQEKM
nr:ERF family protein [Enterococcus faecalis]